eukprot:Cvel_17186.t1-p1 / transcript=Cvel_17186.t1 / gene=Cvel_17186 / organism=Chromera_velia_CCMP2878 / gene_product=hypothetical protein / transcript_product=hypothetical protein / location=Cvel_scaffold1358:619-2198(-) / protein_length=234 / sequence_SO=supercontig / SO=protein_coding / is_pseudo=false
MGFTFHHLSVLQDEKDKPNPRERGNSHGEKEREKERPLTWRKAQSAVALLSLNSRSRLRASQTSMEGTLEGQGHAELLELQGIVAHGGAGSGTGAAGDGQQTGRTLRSGRSSCLSVERFDSNLMVEGTPAHAGVTGRTGEMTARTLAKEAETEKSRSDREKDFWFKRNQEMVEDLLGQVEAAERRAEAAEELLGEKTRESLSLKEREIKLEEELQSCEAQNIRLKAEVEELRKE